MFEVVRVSQGLAAFYPKAIDVRQPYVILLNLANGKLKRLELLDSHGLPRKRRSERSRTKNSPCANKKRPELLVGTKLRAMKGLQSRVKQ
jgi:hypothetical protein